MIRCGCISRHAHYEEQRYLQMSLQTPSDNWWKGGQYFECIWQTKIIHVLQMSDSLFNPSFKGCNVYMSVIKKWGRFNHHNKKEYPHSIQETSYMKVKMWWIIESLSGRRKFLEFDISIEYINSSFLVINRAADIDLSWHSKMWESYI